MKRRLTGTWGRLPTVMILLFALALLAWLLNQRFGIVDWAGAIALHQRLPGAIGSYIVTTVAVLLALAVLGPRLQLGRVAIRQRHLARYAYALTDRRLLVVKSGRITRELHPEDVGESLLHLHDDRTGDLSVRHLNATESNRPDGLVVFESIAEPAAQRRIDDWVTGHLEHASRAVSHTDLAIDALRGFSITRRRSVARHHGQPGKGRTLLQQVTVLHDGRMQLVFMAVWPDGCAPLGEAVALAIRSLTPTLRVDARRELKLTRHPSRA